MAAIFAQLTAWAYRAVHFNCAALLTVHYFLKDENLHVKLYDTNYNLYLTFYLNILKIYHSTLLPFADIVRF